MIPREVRELILSERFDRARDHLATDGGVTDEARPLLRSLVTMREGWARAEIQKPRPPEAAKPFIRQSADGAIEALEKVAAASPWGAWLLAEAYCLKLSLGNPIDVLKLGVRVGALYEKASSSLPSVPDLLVSWGAYGKLNAPLTFGGGPRSAAAKIERALALDANHPEAHAMLGLCRLREKDRAAARTSLDRALAIFPEYGFARRLLALLEERSFAGAPAPLAKEKG